MRASTGSRTKLATGVLALVALVGLLAGCATSATTAPVAKTKTTFVKRAVQAYPNIHVIKNVTYGSGGNMLLKLDVCLPPVSGSTTVTPRPAVVSIHGGSWTHGDKALPDWNNICRWLAASGYVAVSVDYGLAPGHPYPDGITDVEKAVEWLREPAQVKRYAIDPTLIGAFGGSAGGNLAALLGTSGRGALDTGHRVAAVAELSGPTNLTATGSELSNFIPYELGYLGCRRLTSCPNAAEASPLFHVDKSDPPFFVGHSISERIPLSQSTKFVAKLRSVGDKVTFVKVPGARHSIAMLDTGMRTRIAAFFHATLVHNRSGAAQ